MKKPRLRKPEQIRQGCADKFRPVMEKIPLPILGYLLGEDWGEPRIEEIMISDKGVLARIAGRETYATIFCGRECLVAQINCLARAFHLDGDERGYLLAAIAKIESVE